MAEAGDIGPLAMELLDKIERDHPGAEVGHVGIVVELRYPDGTTIEAQCTEDRAWVASALFHRAVKAIERRIL